MMYRRSQSGMEERHCLEVRRPIPKFHRSVGLLTEHLRPDLLEREEATNGLDTQAGDQDPFQKSL